MYKLWCAILVCIVGSALAQKLIWTDLNTPAVAPVMNDFEQLYQAKKSRVQLETSQKELVRLTLSETTWYNKGATLLVGEACKIVRELQTLKELAGRKKYEIEFVRTLSKNVRGSYRISLTPVECRR